MRNLTSDLLWKCRKFSPSIRKKILKRPPKHQNMLERRETFHKSAVSYHTQVTTIMYLGDRLKMFTIKTHFSSIWPIRGKMDPRDLDNRPPGMAHSGRRSFALAYYSPSGISGRHLMYFACIHIHSSSSPTATDGWSDCKENLTLDLHETYKGLPNDQQLSKPCETFHQWTTLYHSWAVIMCNRSYLLANVSR